MCYPTSKLLTLWLAGLTAVSAVVSVSAQSAADTEPDDEIYELSPFTVNTSGDSGYISTNSTAGTSLNAAIRDIPMSLEVINAEVIRDLQATDMKEALDYSAGVFFNTSENTTAANADSLSRDRSPSSFASVNNPFAQTIVIRGYAVPNQQRLGFRVGSIVPAYGVVLGGFTDTSNIERMEVVRGPQSLLYGINVLSGIVNIHPMEPLAEARTQISLSGGNYDYFRTVLDHTGPILEDGSLNYRVVGAYVQQGDWTDFQKDKQEYYAGQIDWRINRKTRLFVEAQYGVSRRNGGGAQYLTDGGAIRDTDFLNKYGEMYTFGYDFFNEDIFTDPRFAPPDGEYRDRTDANGEPFYGNTLLVERPGHEYNFPNMGDGFRLSGPDVFRKQKEYDLLALFYMEPLENLNVEIGGYYTNVDVTERNLAMGVLNNTTGTFGGEIGGNSIYNTEIDAADTIRHGIGELFTSPNDIGVESIGPTLNDLKYGYYIWYEKPTKAETVQLRTRIAYNIETSWFDGRVTASHTFSGGLSYIKDEVDFVQGTTSVNDAYSFRDASVHRLGDDPVYLRNIFDYSPIRYTGQNLAIPGTLSAGRLSNIRTVQDPVTKEPANNYIGQSGWRHADLWYKGKYLVYHGNFWNDRLTIIGGKRWDAYQVLEAEQLRVIDKDYETSNWTGSRIWPITDVLIGYGDQPYQWRSGLPDSLNAKVQQSVEQLRSTQPQGTVSYNFPQDQKYSTNTAGFSYRVIESISVYALYSEGVFPNTGQRDGAYRAIAAEETSNREIGIKFDALDGKVSGTISYFNIKRTNAVWNWPYAPNPARWMGAPLAPSDESSTFNPASVRTDRPIRYGVAEKYVVEAFEELGLPMPKQRGQYRPSDYAKYGVNVINERPNSNPADITDQYIYFFLPYESLESVPDNPFKIAMDKAIRDKASPGHPISWWGTYDEAYNATRASILSDPANVLYEEEGNGVDMQLILTPVPNYQILLGYSHQKREVTGSGFKLAPGFELDGQGNTVDDRIFTTEYDIWVYQIGPENFEDPRDPTTLKGAAINGVDLSFVPQNSFRFWNKYTFSEGPLSGFAVGGGVRWNSSIPTTAGIGGTDLSINRYPTPEVPAHYTVDMLLSYRRIVGKVMWDFALKIDNLLDDRVDEVIAEYPVEGGESVFRRTRQLYQPITFRFSITATF